jgi:hypothetical protein
MRVDRSAHLWGPAIVGIEAELPGSKEDHMAKKAAKSAKKKATKKR